MTEPAEFEAFLKRYQDMVYTVAVRLLKDEAEAQDVAQETFLRAFDRFSGLRTSPTAGGWLRTVATNLSLNHLTRHRARFKLFSEFREEEPGPEELAAEIDAPAPEASDEELDAAVAALPESFRVPLVLFHFEDLAYEEIARRLGVSLAKVKTDILRGRRALRRLLEGA